MKISDASELEMVLFLDENFQVVDGVQIEATQRMRDMLVFARMASFLSDNEALASAVKDLSFELGTEYAKFREVQRDGVNYRRLGAFSCALGKYASYYGFSRKVVILNGQISPADFNDVVGAKIMFRDFFTRAHGEFTHAIQWLLLVQRFGEVAAVYYAKSVQYRSTRTFLAQGGPQRAYMWNFLVDCFDGAEDYRQNIYAKTFRCPQIATERLRTLLPTQSWLGEFLYARRHKGLKNGEEPYVDAHYTNGRTINMKPPHINRTVWKNDGEEIRAYTQLRENIYYKSVIEARKN
ncbi:hypothetical protein DB811_08350 [Xanthomonas perforans]|uniref:LirA/MavJ family T4SS effector n=1 Tax=Xanthomonas perforans TaxID=442694 RepID=UPI000FFEACF7|nr:LirA/MavJ family T4SS effector [Xanthomonas perforans]MBZ2545475.1 hypothetical protein [Xanthomonas perforans]MBZ2566501.1 hypothetical protein [Xanthomonas perforans]MBZ2581171.1 hypothetical protein [Xanthomonas perforans]MBZ3260142.1 hypothetical protein [Xanthomonas perforans]MBZ3279953.1 hypothetical protein [Xanthomonas perforans]